MKSIKELWNKYKSLADNPELMIKEEFVKAINSDRQQVREMIEEAVGLEIDKWSNIRLGALLVKDMADAQRAGNNHQVMVQFRDSIKSILNKLQEE